MENIKIISKDDLKKLIVNKSKFYLIDVLPNEYYKEKHIKGAHNVCVYETIFLDNIQKLKIKKSDIIVLYGSSTKSYDSMDAAEKLRKAGYKDINVYKGGINEWEKLDFNIEYGKVKKNNSLEIKNKKYVISVDRSTIEWTGRNFNGKHVGSLSFLRGFIEFKDEIPINAEFEVDMNSIKNNDIEDDNIKGYLINHLVSEDFFEVNTYPKTMIKLKKSDLIFKGQEGDFYYSILADLTIKNITKEVVFECILGLREEGLSLQTQFFIDRTKWNVTYGSNKFFEKLGKHLVNNMIYFDIYMILI